MSSLKDQLNSRYFEAANRLTSKTAKRRIVAYVESYDDIYFWRTVLNRFEDQTRYFEVMLPSHKKLERGKKSVLMNFIGDQIGPTYAYAIENLQCYAPTLHEVCVAITLNDHRIFDFDDYLRQYSEAIFPLFVWSVWAYRTGMHNKFSMSDFGRVVDPGGFNVANPQPSIDHLRKKVNTKIHHLQQEFPEAKEEYLKTKESIKALGVTPQTTYLYIQGHHLFDNVVIPILNKVCNRLRQERQDEITRTARHHTQRRNEMSCYEHSLLDIRLNVEEECGVFAFRTIPAHTTGCGGIPESLAVLPEFVGEQYQHGHNFQTTYQHQE